MTVLNEWFFPRGTLTRDRWECVVDGNTPGWTYTGIHVAALDDDTIGLPAADIERIVVPLSGSFQVAHEGTTTVLNGRDSVFDGPCDVLYVGAEEPLTVGGSGRVAIAEARTSIRKPSRYIARAGRSGRAARRRPRQPAGAQLRDAGRPGRGGAARLRGHHPRRQLVIPPRSQARRVLSRAARPQLEEIYYFEAAPARGTGAPAGADAFGTFATYSSSAGEIETRALVRTGDIALVPYGYHGPAAAAPEYDLYYLNVMAGPGPSAPGCSPTTRARHGFARSWSRAGA